VYPTTYIAPRNTRHAVLVWMIDAVTLGHVELSFTIDEPWHSVRQDEMIVDRADVINIRAHRHLSQGDSYSQRSSRARRAQSSDGAGTWVGRCTAQSVRYPRV
jgi:hypothetical protein